MPAIKRNVVKQGIGASMVVLLCCLCFAFGWTSHKEITDQVGENVSMFDATFRFYESFNSPESFFSALGAFLLITVKVIMILKNKRQGER